MTDEEVGAWVERLWRLGAATKIDREHRQLAAAMFEKAVDNPEQTAHLIAVLVSRTQSPAPS